MVVEAGLIPTGVREVCRELERAGYHAWIVGGCVRDLLIGRKVSDWDVCTTALPQQVTRVFHKVIPTGIQHGTVTVMLHGEAFEVTTLRGETTYTDGRHPDSVFFVNDLKEDLARRDFTINAIAYDVNLQAIVDPFDGVGDVGRKTIRAVGSASERFAEDGLRVLRGARFCATLEFALDRATHDAMAANLRTFRRVSVERIREEWLKTMKAARPSRAFAVMMETGILAAVSPELALALSVGERRRTFFELMDSAEANEPFFRLMALFTALEPTQCDALLKYLKFSNDERKRCSIIMQALRSAPLTSYANEGLLRRWLRTVGAAHLNEWMILARGLAVAEDNAERKMQIDECFDHAMKILDRGDALALGDLAIDGVVLQKELGIQPSKLMGTLLHHLLERVLDDPSLNERSTLLAIARTHPNN